MTGVAYFVSVQPRAHDPRTLIDAGQVRAEASLAAGEDRHAIELSTVHQRPTMGVDRPSRSLEADR